MSWVCRIENIHRRSWRRRLNAAQLRLKPLWNRLFPGAPLPVQLPYGGWWLAIDDTISDAILTCGFEEAEWHFVSRFLKKGMTVLDIGAHHGFYTVLASKKIGNSGIVIAFEPSPREQQRLQLHLKINHCTNVKVEPLALSSQNGKASLFLVEGRGTAFNSLRPPAISTPTQRISVSTMPLDNYIEKEGIRRVDFIKMDTEGAELEILRGAAGLFNRNSRPIIMIEISDLRSAPWGYCSSAIYKYLSERGYHWFSIGSQGNLQPFPENVSRYNFIAVPEGNLATIQELIQPGKDLMNAV